MQPPAPPNQPCKHGESSAGTVVLIGASIRSAAESASRAGFRVLGIDLFGDLDTRQMCEEFWILSEFQTNPELIRRLRQYPQFMVGGLNPTHESAHPPSLPTKTLKTFPNPKKEGSGSPASVIEKTNFARWDDPHWLAQLSKQSGLNFPRFFHAQTPNTAPPQTPGKRWLTKTVPTSGGLGVHWHTPVQLTDTAHSDLESCSGSTESGHSKLFANSETLSESVTSTTSHRLFQEWVPGRPHGATLLCNGEDCTLLGVCRSLFTRIGDLPFVYRGSFGPVAISDALRQSLQTLGLRITRETGHRGLLNIDLVINRANETSVLEVNPRWSGSSELIERWMQNRNLLNSLFGAMHEAYTGLPLTALKTQLHGSSASLASPWSAGPKFLKRIVFAREDFQFSQDLLTITKQPWSDNRYRSTFSDLPTDGTWISSGDPICTLVSQIPHGDDTNPNGLSIKKGPMHQHWTFLRHLYGSADC